MWILNCWHVFESGNILPPLQHNVYEKERAYLPYVPLIFLELLLLSSIQYLVWCLSRNVSVEDALPRRIHAHMYMRKAMEEHCCLSWLPNSRFIPSSVGRPLKWRATANWPSMRCTVLWLVCSAWHRLSKFRARTFRWITLLMIEHAALRCVNSWV